MEEYGYLLFIALVLISTKFLGLVTKKFHMPQVVGALVAGLIIGPACLNLSSVLLAGAESQSMIESLSEVGVIVLMFSAGLETDIQKLKKSGLASLVIALMGVIVPCLGGYLVAYFFTDGGGAADLVMYRNIFIGVILTATSVSITVETLREMGKLNTNAGNAILGAAVIDDVLGIIALTIITTLGTGGEGGQGGPSIWMVLLKIVLFFIFAFVVAFGVGKLYYKWTNVEHEPYRRYGIIAFAFCLLFAFCSEYFFNVADITGAYVAGLAISVSPKIQYISKRFETVSYMFLSPIFFASIGLKTNVESVTGSILLFSLGFVLVGLISKIVGCGLMAKLCRFRLNDSLKIGIGMMTRGEVALIVAQKGLSAGLLEPVYFTSVILLIIVSSIATPILLKVLYSKDGEVQTA